MKRSLWFSLSGSANINLEDVVFFDCEGKTVDVSQMSTEEIQDKLINFELDWDWLSLASHPDFGVSVDEYDIIEESCN